MFTDVDDVDSHFRRKTATAEKKRIKRGNSEQFNEMVDNTFIDMDSVGGTTRDLNREDVALRLSSGATSSGSAFAVDALRVGPLESLIPKKSAPEEEAQAEGKTDAAAHSDPQTDEEPGDSKKAPFFDRDRQVAAGRRNAGLSIETLTLSVEKASEEVQKFVKTLSESDKNVTFKVEVEILQQRANGLTVFLQEENMQKFTNVYHAHMGVAPSQTPPFPGFQLLKSKSEMRALLDGYKTVTTREDLIKVSKDVGQAKKPAQALVTSVTSYLAELRKAKAAMEEQLKRKTEGPPKESPKSGKKAKQDLFEMLAEVGSCICVARAVKTGDVMSLPISVPAPTESASEKYAATESASEKYAEVLQVGNVLAHLCCMCILWQVVAVPHIASPAEYDSLNWSKSLATPFLLTKSSLESKKVHAQIEKILKVDGALSRLLKSSLLELDKEAAVRSPCRGFWHIEDALVAPLSVGGGSSI